MHTVFICRQFDTLFINTGQIIVQVCLSKSGWGNRNLPKPPNSVSSVIPSMKQGEMPANALYLNKTITTAILDQLYNTAVEYVYLIFY